MACVLIDLSMLSLFAIYSHPHSHALSHPHSHALSHPHPQQLPGDNGAPFHNHNHSRFASRDFDANMLAAVYAPYDPVADAPNGDAYRPPPRSERKKKDSSTLDRNFLFSQQYAEAQVCVCVCIVWVCMFVYVCECGYRL
jgi:hypothetical protein